MNKLILIASTILLLGSCCPNQKRLSTTKVEYLRIGFENGKESYLQINGTGLYKIRYDDLVMQIIEHPEHACNEQGFETIASDVNFFSVVSEQEYNIKHLGVEPTSTPSPTPDIY
jgi:hypothetical protein